MTKLSLFSSSSSNHSSDNFVIHEIPGDEEIVSKDISILKESTISISHI
jgi:hypothetical protein